MAGPSQRFLIRQSKGMRFFVTLYAARDGDVVVDDDTVVVHYGAMFKATIPRSTITAAEPWSGRVGGWGAHGWRGRWLVNGSSKGIVRLTIEPMQQASCIGIRVKLRELRVSLDDPTGFLAALA